MQIDRDGTWLLIAACCVLAAVYVLPRLLRHDFYARHERWTDAPLRFVAASLSATLTATAVGMGLAFAVLAFDVALMRLLG